MKAQLFSIDLLVAITIFFTILGLISYFWIIGPNVQSYDMQEKANLVSGFLVSYKLGTENGLKCWKVVDLASKNYNETRTEINAYPYDIFIEFKNTSSICNGDQVNIGESKDSSRIVSVVRLVYLDDQMMQMVVRLYE
jgi:hypothetical protein